MRFNWKIIAVALGLTGIATYPLVHGNMYIMHILILFFIWSAVASNWNLLMGVAGITSLGNIGFLAVGGYASGILAKQLGWSPWGCVILGGLIAMVIVTKMTAEPDAETQAMVDEIRVPAGRTVLDTQH